MYIQFKSCVQRELDANEDVMFCLVKCLADECVLTLIFCSGYCPHCILKTLQAGFDPVQSLFSDCVEGRFLVVITSTL